MGSDLLAGKHGRLWTADSLKRTIATMPSAMPISWRFLHPSLVTNSSMRFPQVSLDAGNRQIQPKASIFGGQYHVRRYGVFFSASATQSNTCFDNTWSPNAARSGLIAPCTSAGRYTMPVSIRHVESGLNALTVKYSPKCEVVEKLVVYGRSCLEKSSRTTGGLCVQV